MDFKTAVANEILAALRAAFEGAELPEAGTIAGALEVPPDTALGDYAFPCFKLSKALRKSPMMIADALAGAIHADFVGRGLSGVDSPNAALVHEGHDGDGFRGGSGLAEPRHGAGRGGVIEFFDAVACAQDECERNGRDECGYAVGQLHCISQSTQMTALVRSPMGWLMIGFGPKRANTPPNVPLNE